MTNQTKVEELRDYVYRRLHIVWCQAWSKSADKDEYVEENTKFIMNHVKSVLLQKDQEYKSKLEEVFEEMISDIDQKIAHWHGTASMDTGYYNALCGLKQFIDFLRQKHLNSHPSGVYDSDTRPTGSKLDVKGEK